MAGLAPLRCVQRATSLRAALPTWFGWFALVVAVALVATVPFGPGATMEPLHVLGFLWIVCVSVLMIVRRDVLLRSIPSTFRPHGRSNRLSGVSTSVTG